MINVRSLRIVMGRVMEVEQSPKSAQVFATDLQLSEDLRGFLARLTPAQAAGVIRIAEAELAGQSVESLFAGEGKICSRSTYYRRNGWVHKADFQNALGLARREIRANQMVAIVRDALEELKAATPLAARDLKRQVAGDETAIDALGQVATNRKRPQDERLSAIVSLGQVATSRASSVLLALIDDPNAEIRVAALTALGPAAAGTNAARRLASIAVLDRADETTADKGSGVSAGELETLRIARWQQVAPALAGLMHDGGGSDDV